MATEMVIAGALFFIVVLIFDVSFNLRRIAKNLERLLRKLAEIADLLQKNY
ncbi:MAG: hypothetical protein V1923_01070 [Candidatus Omnitrophota bacterium]